MPLTGEPAPPAHANETSATIIPEPVHESARTRDDQYVETRDTAVRLFSPEDREPIRRLLIETNVFTPAEVEIALELVDRVVNEPLQKDYIAYTCVERGEVLGYYCIGPTPATEGTFDLYWIAVKPREQRKGIGRKLIHHAERVILAEGGRLVMVETSSQPRYERTRKFYHDQGYSELSRIRDYYRVGDDLVVYGKYLI